MSIESQPSFATQPSSPSAVLSCSLDSSSSQLTANNASTSSLNILEEIGEESQSKGWVNIHFERLDMDSKRMRACLAPGCRKQYAASTSTRVFKNHWLKHHSKSPMNKRTRFVFHDLLHINRLIKAIIDLHLDFNVVDKPSFRRLMEAMNPSRHIICRKTVSDILLHSKEKLRKELVDKLSQCGSVALTFDLWSARKGTRGFGCITAHYIDLDWKLKEAIIQFKQMSYPHDAQTIRKFINKTIELTSLTGKIVSITTDNASNNIAAVKLWGGMRGLDLFNFDIVHYKCVAHVIDLGLRAALLQLTSSITPVREAVLSIRSSRKRKEKFIAIQTELIANKQQNSSYPLELAEDVDHRWNSAFILIERASQLEQAIDIMLETTQGLGSLDKIDWTTVKVIMEFLRPFYETTKRLCATTKITISLVAAITPKLINHCANYEDNPNEHIKAAATSLRDKLTSYEPEIYNSVVNLAYFLDPRFKSKNLSEELTKLVCDKLRYLMDLVPNPTKERVNLVSAFGDDTDDEESVDELQTYLAAKRAKNDIDAVDWWSLNRNNFPKLSFVARYLLPIQATSVASERVFSIAGDVDTKKRNRLSDEAVENIVLFKSWLQFLDLE